MSQATITPGQHRQLRACMICTYVTTQALFHKQGCPNCDFLGLRANTDAILDATSQVFEGLMTINEPQTSWIARWQRLDGYVPGVYAVKVSGNQTEEVLGKVENAGVRYIPRDGSSEEEENT